MKTLKIKNIDDYIYYNTSSKICVFSVCIYMVCMCMFELTHESKCEKQILTQVFLPQFLPCLTILDSLALV